MIDLLIEKIAQKGNPTVLGVDTRLEYLPEDMRQGVDSLEAAAEAIWTFNRRLIDALAPIVPAVKVQVAYYEMYGVPGMRIFRDTLAYAQQQGLVAIADVKRNDIGATASAYAQAYLGAADVNGARLPAFPCDGVTVNGYLGVDGVKPFVDLCGPGKGIFVLVKTSNPSSGQLQDLPLEQGGTIYEKMGQLVEQWGAGQMGEHGYSRVGAVVGATYPAQGTALRAQMPHTFFLVPGYGAQGATGKDLAGCFDAQGRGALVNASRSLLCAHQKHPELGFPGAAVAEAERMRADITGALAAAGKGNW